MIRKLRFAGLIIAVIALVLTFTIPFHLIWIPVILIIADMALLIVLQRMERRASEVPR